MCSTFTIAVGQMLQASCDTSTYDVGPELRIPQSKAMRKKPADAIIFMRGQHDQNYPNVT
jgi:hypothetical protein